MSKNDDAIINRLDELYELYKDADQNGQKLPLNSITKYALFSDLELKQGTVLCLTTNHG